MDGKETRAIPLDLAEFRVAQMDDGTKVLQGYAAVFNELSEDLGGFREQIARGAFTNALKASDTRMLYNHNDDYPLARESTGSLELTEDKKGLFVRAKMPKWADWIVESIELGNVDKMSFGFWVKRDEWNHDTNVRTLLEIEELVEVSPVVFPAYPATNIDVAIRRREMSKESSRQTLTCSDVSNWDKDNIPTATDSDTSIRSDSDDIDGASIRSVDRLKERLDLRLNKEDATK